MAALATVEDYVEAARVLLQDTASPYRYPDADFVAALNLGLLEARRLRPDLFIDNSDDVPSFTAVNTDAVEFDQQYRLPLVYFITGHIQLRDDEEGTDARAGTFVSRFRSDLVGIG
jgi:hypothetical protein